MRSDFWALLILISMFLSSSVFFLSARNQSTHRISLAPFHLLSTDGREDVVWWVVWCDVIWNFIHSFIYLFIHSFLY